MENKENFNVFSFLPYIFPPILTGLLQPFFESLGKSYFIYIALGLVWLLTSLYIWFKSKNLNIFINVTLIAIVVALVIYLVSDSKNKRDYLKETTDIVIHVIADCNKNFCKEEFEKGIARIPVSLISNIGMEAKPKYTDDTGQVIFRNIGVDIFPLKIKVCRQARTHLFKKSKTNDKYKKKTLFIEVYMESSEQCKK